MTRTPAQQAVLDLYLTHRRAGEDRYVAALMVRDGLARDAMRSAALHGNLRISRDAADRFRVAEQFVAQVCESEFDRWAARAKHNIALAGAA